MGVESIEFGLAEDGFRTYLHEDQSVQNLVERRDSDSVHYPDDEVVDFELIGWRPGVKEWLILSCVSVLAMMDAFDMTVAMPLLPDLSTTFEQPLRDALWIDTSYILANAASQFIFAMLSEVFGQGPVLIISAVIATVGTGVCSGSLSLQSLVAGRLVQGIGSGGTTGVSFLVMTDLIPYPHRVRFFDYTCRAWVIGSMFGPVLGGLVDEYGKWSWAFYSSFVFCALGLLVIPFAIDLRECKNISTDAAREMDWMGVVITPVAIGCLLIGIGSGGAPSSGWDDWKILLPFSVGGFAMLVLVLYETLWTPQPMFNLGIFRNIPTTMVYVGSLLRGILVFCHLQNLPMYLIFVKYLSPVLTGLSIAVITGPSLPALFLTSKMRMLKKPYLSRWIIRAGWFLNFLASACFIMLDANTPPPGWIFVFFAAGTSHALLLSGYNTYIHTVASNPPRLKRRWSKDRARHGRAGSQAFAILMFSVLQTWGMCIAIPVSGTIMLSQLMQDAKGIGRGGEGAGPAGGGGGIVGGSGLFSSLDSSKASSLLRLGGMVFFEEDRDELGIAFLHSFRVVWRFFMGVSALGGLSSLLIR